jgi:hypothetical protein
VSRGAGIPSLSLHLFRLRTNANVFESLHFLASDSGTQIKELVCIQKDPEGHQTIIAGTALPASHVSESVGDRKQQDDVVGRVRELFRKRSLPDRGPNFARHRA